MRWLDLPEPVANDLQEQMWRILAAEKEQRSRRRDWSLRTGVALALLATPLAAGVCWFLAAAVGLGVR